MTTLASRYSDASPPPRPRPAVVGPGGTLSMCALLVDCDTLDGRGRRSGAAADEPTDDVRSSATSDGTLPSSSEGKGRTAELLAPP